MPGSHQGPESAALVAARQLAEEAHHRRAVGDLHRRRPMSSARDRERRGDRWTSSPCGPPTGRR